MNRFLEHTGAKYPIVQAPIGWTAWSQLAVQPASLIDDVKTAKQIIDETMEELFIITERMSALNADKKF